MVARILLMLLIYFGRKYTVCPEEGLLKEPFLQPSLTLFQTDIESCMEARVTDAELLGLAERSWTSMASIVGQEMEGGKVGYKSTHDQEGP